MTVLHTGIAELVTHDPELGVLTDAAIVTAEDMILWVGPAASAPAADERVFLGGRAVVPGFVDAHAHLVFAGDRSAEFAARMAGQPYDGGGIASTVEATRAASDAELRTLVAARVAEMRAQGTTTVEIKSGYGLTVADEARALAIAAEVTPETTFLGAHVVPPGRRSATPTSSWSRARCSPPARRTPAGSTCSASPPARTRSTATRRAPCSPPAAPPGWGCGCTATSSGHGPGVALAVELERGERRPLHLPVARRRRRAGRRRHRRDPAAGRRVLHPLALPGRAAP